MTITLTGGAGSLGKAFVQLLHKEHTLIVIDNNEWAIAALQGEYPNVETRLEDFGSYDFIEKPDVLIHLAAYKHVNLGETNPYSFVENNLVKTDRLFRRAQNHNTRILFISTDKAVEPVSVYGMTKAIGEQLAWFYGGQVARLGNIMNSSGSVIPVWEEAIAKQQPIKVTDFRMQRYMITDRDAASQIWHGFEGQKRLIVPDMPPPLSLLQILEATLRQHGYQTINDYQPGVDLIGARPGERMDERLYWPWEEQ